MRRRSGEQVVDPLRRRIVGAIGASAILGGLGRPRSLTAQPGQTLDVAPLRDGLLQISGNGGNVVAVRSDAGVLLVDSGTAEQSASLKQIVLDRFGGAPIRVLFNTHWHLEHTGGNDAIIADEVTAISHENTRLWMSSKFFVDWENRRYLPRAEGALPNKTFFSHERQPLQLELGGQTAVYAHLAGAHTDGDIYVSFPEHNVIVAGGAATANDYPVLDYITGGWIGGLVESTRKLIALADADTLIVPAAGPAQRRTDLEAHVEMLETVRTRIEAIALEGRGVDDMIAEKITEEFDAHYRGDPALFIANAYEGMWWNRLRGTSA